MFKGNPRRKPAFLTVPITEVIHCGHSQVLGGARVSNWMQGVRMDATAHPRLPASGNQTTNVLDNLSNISLFSFLEIGDSTLSRVFA